MKKSKHRPRQGPQRVAASQILAKREGKRSAAPGLVRTGKSPEGPVLRIKRFFCI